MTDAGWQRIEEIFNRVADLPAGEREAALAREADGDEALREAVAGLLRALEREESQVRGVVDRAWGSSPEPEPASREGVRAGPYTLVRSLGEGGMGSVYLARRSDDAYAAEVAVKVLKAGMVDRDAGRRFRAERQILAELNHPGIARLFDGGVTDDGAPYLVMEHVDGPPIDVWCAEKELSTRAVLELFRKVCDAVQYAHGRLVVHRDLKPANILVQGNGQPKLLDFGIAKLLADDPSDADPGLTQTGFRPMTPSYASPEQVRGEPVTTATDVYALGVLLYELLTGVLPYPKDAGDRRALEGAILDHTPAAPSVALTTRDDARTTDGGSRASTARTLRGDLDTIVLKALQKDPARRYGSVEQLSEDVGRHLSGLPVRARPDTLTYRAGKFVRRNTGAVASGTLSFLLISGLAANSAWQAARLERERDAVRLERDKATAVSDFLVGVFQASDPSQAQGVDMTAGDILANGRRRADEELAGNPQVQAAVMAAIGLVYENLGDYVSADSVFAGRLERARSTWGDRSTEYAEALLDLAALQNRQDRFDEADKGIRTALDILTERLGPDAAGTSDAWLTLADEYVERGEDALAEAPLQEALRIRRETRGDTLGPLNMLAVVYGNLQRLDESIDLSRRVLAAQRAELGPVHADVLTSLNNLGTILMKAGRNEEAARYLREGLTMAERILPPGHPSIQGSRNNLAALLATRLHRYDEAQALLDTVVSAVRARGDRGSLARALFNKGGIAALSGDYALSLAALSESLDLLVPLLGPDSPFLGNAYSGIGFAQHQLGRLDAAEASFKEALRVQRPVAAQDPTIANTLRNYGRLLVETGRIDEAEPVIDEADSLYARAFPENDPQRLSFDTVLAELRLTQGRRDEARALLEKVVSASGPDGGARLARAQELLREHFGAGGA